ncbi:tyrosine-protein phosphatase [Rhodococcus sp. WS4]|nr:tyrosine-protein phosphatase [Rhodococcus sp. WS4]
MYEGSLNFREVGGLLTTDGRRRLRRGLLFRSGTPQLMTEQQARLMIDQTDVRFVIDLRQEQEAIDEGQGGLAAVPHERISAPLLVDEAVQGGSAVPIMSDVDPLVPHYLGYLPSSVDSILRIFRALADPGTGPTLLHCTAGKDRTGAALMLVLDAIGIDRQAIIDDYVAGKDEIASIFDILISLPSYGDRLAALPAEARNTYPDTAKRYLLALDEKYGGIRNWLHDHGFGAPELAAMRETLTEVPPN